MIDLKHDRHNDCHTMFDFLDSDLLHLMEDLIRAHITDDKPNELVALIDEALVASTIDCPKITDCVVRSWKRERGEEVY